QAGGLHVNLHHGSILRSENTCQIPIPLKAACTAAETAAVHKIYLCAACLVQDNRVHLLEYFSLVRELQSQQNYFHQNTCVLPEPFYGALKYYSEQKVCVNRGNGILI